MRDEFTLDGYTVRRGTGSRNFYAHWYDTRAKRGKRRSLGTDDHEQAKRELAKWVVRADAALGEKPGAKTAIVTVLDHYINHRLPEISNQDAPRRAFALLIDFLLNNQGMSATVPVTELTLPIQTEFMDWCATEHGHTAGGIERNMVAIRAALNFAAKDQLITVNGEKKQIRLIDRAPTVKTTQTYITKHTSAGAASKRDWIPTYEQLAALFNTQAPPYLKRYDLLALYTWARPEAIWELNCDTQIDRQAGLLDLNPPGRKQNNKHRPQIRLCQGLAQWTKTWGAAFPLKATIGLCQCRSKNTLKSAFQRRTQRWQMIAMGMGEREALSIQTRAYAGYPGPMRDAIAESTKAGNKAITPYTLRHFMATRVRSLPGVTVSREQRQAWLGHTRSDTTAYYESHDPEFLRECELATDQVVAKLDGLTDTTLVPDQVRTALRLVTTG